MSADNPAQIKASSLSIDHSELSEQDIAGYLQHNPDFFDRFPHLLNTIVIPHESGEAVSLVERQLGTLREHNASLKAHLEELVSSARANDALFGKSAQFALALWQIETWEQLNDVIRDQLISAFAADFACLHVDNLHASDSGAHVFSAAAPAAELAASLTTVRCHPVRASELADWFGAEPASEAGSVALVPVPLTAANGESNATAVLAIGSRDPARFDDSLGTVFLDFIGANLAQAVTRLRGKA